MTRGDSLWGWQSQQEDGSWSLIAMFVTTEAQARRMGIQELRAKAPEMMVLIHRDPQVATSFRTQAMAHRDRYGQPIRFARFDLVMIESEIDGRGV